MGKNENWKLHVKFRKVDESVDEQGRAFTLVKGAVLVPEIVDKQGDLIPMDEVEKACHRFMVESQRGGVMHQLVATRKQMSLAECYIDSTGKSLPGVNLRPGTWVIAYRVYDESIRKLIKSGKLRGFSIGGTAKDDAGG